MMSEPDQLLAQFERDPSQVSLLQRWCELSGRLFRIHDGKINDYCISPLERRWLATYLADEGEDATFWGMRRYAAQWSIDAVELYQLSYLLGAACDREGAERIGRDGRDRGLLVAGWVNATLQDIEAAVELVTTEPSVDFDDLEPTDTPAGLPLSVRSGGGGLELPLQLCGPDSFDALVAAMYREDGAETVSGVGDAPRLAPLSAVDDAVFFVSFPVCDEAPILLVRRDGQWSVCRWRERHRVAAFAAPHVERFEVYQHRVQGWRLAAPKTDVVGADLVTHEEQMWLIDVLRHLIEEGGPQPFDLGLLVKVELASGQQDDLEARVLGLGRSLLNFVGLRERGLDLQLGPASAFDVHDLEASVWLLDVDDERVSLAVAKEVLEDRDRLLAGMCREVARAYRWSRDLSLAVDREEEEREVDVTGHYLGFGLFLTLVSHRVMTWSAVDGSGFAERQAEHWRFGALPPQAMCFLLALRSCATQGKGVDLTRYLPAHLVHYYQQACAVLSDDPAPLRERLGLPEQVLREGALSLSAEDQSGAVAIVEEAGAVSLEVPATEPQGPSKDEARDRCRWVELDASTELRPAPQPVYRVIEARPVSTHGWLVSGLSVIGSVAALTQGLYVLAGAALLGYFVGWFKLREPVLKCQWCETQVAEEALECSRCGANFLGSVWGNDRRLLDLHEADEAETETETETVAETDTETDTETVAETETVTVAETETDTDTETVAETDTETETDSETVTVAETDTETETDSESY